MTSEEYGLRLAEYAIDPWDERRADMRAALNTATLHWVNGNKKAEVSDFMPYEPVFRQTQEDVFAFTESINNG